ncbi:uncharacterized protein LOC136076621 isoform X3 [Hydra vulgaris]
MFKLGESFVKLTRHYITSTDESMAFSCSDSFASFAVLKEAIRKYEDTSFIKLWVRDARTIEAARKSIPKKAALMAADIKYYFIKYCCIHGGQKFKYCGKGKRKTSTFKKDCPFYLNFKASEDGQFLVLHTMNNTHNHEVSEILYKHLPNQRKLPDYAIEKAKELMHLKPNKKLLQKELIKSTGKIITLRDLSNIAASSNKVENRNDITTFVTTLKDKYMMLSWFLKADDVQKALSGTLINKSAVEKRPNCIPSSILDESALELLSSLQIYFSSDAWKALDKVIKAKKNQHIWPCAVCLKSTSEENKTGNAIACDSCLLWSHKKCVGQKENSFLKAR